MNVYSALTALIILNILFGGAIACLIGLTAHQHQRLRRAERKADAAQRAARKSQRRLIALHGELELGDRVDRAILDALKEGQS